MILSDVCQLKTGLPPKLRLVSDQPVRAKVIRIQDITEDGSFDLSLLRFENVPLSYDLYSVEPGDLIFLSEGDFHSAISLPAHLSKELVALSPLYILRPDRTRVLPEYIAWQINQTKSQLYFKRLVRHTADQKIEISNLAELDIDLPDIPSQSQILETLTLIEEQYRLQSDLTHRQKVYAELKLASFAKDLASLNV